MDYLPLTSTNQTPDIFKLDEEFNCMLGAQINVSKLQRNKINFSNFQLLNETQSNDELGDLMDVMTSLINLTSGLPPLNLSQNNQVSNNSQQSTGTASVNNISEQASSGFLRYFSGSSRVIPTRQNSNPYSPYNSQNVSVTYSDSSGRTIRMSNMSPNEISQVFPSTLSFFGGMPVNMQSNFARLISQLIREDTFEDVRVPLSAETFKKLGEERYIKIKKNFEDNNIRCDEACTICQDDFEDTDVVTDVKCKNHHLFHTECIKPWLLEMSKVCPVCKEDLSGETEESKEDEEC